MYKINNLSKYELGENGALLEDFLQYAINRFEVNKPFKVVFVTDSENAQNPLGKTGAYHPSTANIYIYTDGRLFKDILRSIAHEMYHHSQNCKGEFDNQNLALAPGYAQEDDYMREIERSAYEQGNLALRDWEDGKKKMKLKVVKENKKTLKEYDIRQIPFELAFCKDKDEGTKLPQNVVAAAKAGGFDLQGWACLGDGRVGPLGAALAKLKQKEEDAVEVDEDPHKPKTHVDLPEPAGDRSTPKFDKEFIESLERGQIAKRMKALRLRQDVVDKIKVSAGWDPKRKKWVGKPTLTQDQILTSIYAMEKVKRSDQYKEGIAGADFWNLFLDALGFFPTPGDPVDFYNGMLKLKKYEITGNRFDQIDAWIDFLAFAVVGQPLAWVRSTFKAVEAGAASVKRMRALLKGLKELRIQMMKLSLKIKRGTGGAKKWFYGEDHLNQNVLDIDKEIARLESNIEFITMRVKILYSERYAKIMRSYKAFEGFVDANDLVRAFKASFVDRSLAKAGETWAAQLGLLTRLEGGGFKVNVSRMEALKAEIVGDIGDFVVKPPVSDAGGFVRLEEPARKLEEIIAAIPNDKEGAEIIAKLHKALTEGTKGGGGQTFSSAGGFFDWLALNTGKNKADISFEEVTSPEKLLELLDKYVSTELLGRWNVADEALSSANLKMFYKWLTETAPVMAETNPTIKKAFDALQSNKDSKKLSDEEAVREFIKAMETEYMKSPDFVKAASETWGRLSSSLLARTARAAATHIGTAVPVAKSAAWRLYDEFRGAYKRISLDPENFNIISKTLSKKWPARMAVVGVALNGVYRTPIKLFFRDRYTGGGSGTDQWVGFGNTKDSVRKIKARLAGDKNIPASVRTFFKNLNIDDPDMSDKNTKLILAGAATYLKDELDLVAEFGKSIVEDLKETGKIAPADADAIFNKDGKIRPWLKKILDLEKDRAKAISNIVGGNVNVSTPELEKRAEEDEVAAKEGLQTAQSAAEKGSKDKEREAKIKRNVAAAKARLAQAKKNRKAVQAMGTKEKKLSAELSKAKAIGGGAVGTVAKAPGEKDAPRDLPPGMGTIGDGPKVGLNKDPLIKKRKISKGVYVLPIKALEDAIDGNKEGWLYKKAKATAGDQRAWMAQQLKTAFRKAGMGDGGQGGTTAPVLKCIAKAPSDREMKKYINNISLKTAEASDANKIKAIAKTWECGEAGKWKINKYEEPAVNEGIKLVIKENKKTKKESTKSSEVEKVPTQSVEAPRDLNKTLEKFFESELEKRFTKLTKGMTEQ